MEGASVFLLFGLIVFIAIMFRLVAGGIDAGRIEDYVHDQGWTLVDRSWDPFGPGWFGEKDSRIYQIVYRDRQGNVHKAHVKTSMLSGVYLTNDHIVEHADTNENEKVLEERQVRGEIGTLRLENERLRRRIQELERKQEES